MIILFQGSAQQSSDMVFHNNKKVIHKQFIPKQGAEIGFFLPVNFFRGNLNGESVLLGENVMILLPKIEPNVGLGAVFGLMTNILI